MTFAVKTAKNSLYSLYVYFPYCYCCFRLLESVRVYTVSYFQFAWFSCVLSDGYDYVGLVLVVRWPIRATIYKKLTTQ